MVNWDNNIKLFSIPPFRCIFLSHLWLFYLYWYRYIAKGNTESWKWRKEWFKNAFSISFFWGAPIFCSSIVDILIRASQMSDIFQKVIPKNTILFHVLKMRGVLKEIFLKNDFWIFFCNFVILLSRNWEITSLILTKMVIDNFWVLIL